MNYCENEILVSLIVPIFNGEMYIDNCLKAICEQSYKNFEILLLDDGSYDNTRKICKSWEEKDDRIHYYYHKNMGQGPTETIGIEYSKGLYITFIDIDDRILPYYVERMLNEILKNNADVCECCWTVYDDKTNKTVEVHRNIKNSSLAYKCKYPHLWGRLYKKSIFTKNELLIPKCKHQDLATYPLLLLLGVKLCYVDNVLYIYRINSGESVSDKLEDNFYYSEVFSHLYTEAGRLNLGKRDEFFKNIAEIHINSRLRKERRQDNRIYELVYSRAKNFFYQFFPNWNYIDKCLLIGSYNLSRINNYLSFNYDVLSDYKFFFWQSSIISLMSKPVCEKKIVNNDWFHDIFLQKDLNKSFLQIKRNTNQIVLIDFLEERYDIIKSNYSYITKSQIYDEASIPGQDSIISYDSYNRMKIWKDSCLEFIDYLKSHFAVDNIYLIEFYYSEIALDESNHKAYFSNTSFNDILEKYYCFFKENFSEIQIINIPTNLCYTDSNFPHGCYPYYYNDEVYFYIAQQIKCSQERKRELLYEYH